MDKSIRQGLKDQSYEHRKATTLDLTRLVSDCVAAGQMGQVTAIIEQLSREFIYDVSDPHARYGGLIGLAAVGLGLGGAEIPKYLKQLTEPVFACFGDHDSNVRYNACETIYNLYKVAKGETLLYFNDIFDIVSKAISDPDQSVRNGANIVDRLLKDIVIEKATNYVSVLQLNKSDFNAQPLARVIDKQGKFLQFYDQQTPKAFQLSKFIPLLKERMYSINNQTRVFILNWLMLFDSIPDLELISYLPSFLEPLLGYLGCSNSDVRIQTEKLLNMLLHEINRIYQVQKLDDQSSEYIPGQDTKIDYAKIIDILVNNLESNDVLIKIICLEWLSNLLTISPESFTILIPKLLAILLNIISDNKNIELQNMAIDFNFKLIKLVGTDLNETNFPMLISKLINQLSDKQSNKLAKLYSLDWLIMLHDKSHEKFMSENQNSVIFTTLLQCLNDKSDQVINKDLELLSKVADQSDDDYFHSFMIDLLDMFKNDRDLLDTKGDFILRRLYQPLNPQRVYQALSTALYDDMLKGQNLSFITIMIQILNNNIIIAPELAKFRHDLMNNTNAELFQTLFKCWSLNSPSLLSLTLLTSNYQLAYQIILDMSQYEINLGVFIQLDLLIQLLESPIFAKMRLDLLMPDKNVYLYHCLYGLLMLLPQSNSFKILQNRLNAIAPIVHVPLPEKSTADEKSSKFDELLALFNESQRMLNYESHINKDTDLSESINDLSLNNNDPVLKPARSSYAEMFPHVDTQEQEQIQQPRTLDLSFADVDVNENDFGDTTVDSIDDDQVPELESLNARTFSQQLAHANRNNEQQEQQEQQNGEENGVNNKEEERDDAGDAKNAHNAIDEDEGPLETSSRLDV